MIITTGILALSRRIADERAKKAAEAKGNNDGQSTSAGETHDFANRTFASRRLRASNSGQRPSGAQSQRSFNASNGPQMPPIYTTPYDVGAARTTSRDPSNLRSNSVGSSVYSDSTNNVSGGPEIQIHDARSSSRINVSSPVESQAASLTVASPSSSYSNSRFDNNSVPLDFDSRMSLQAPPPAYSERPASTEFSTTAASLHPNRARSASTSTAQQPSSFDSSRISDPESSVAGRISTSTTRTLSNNSNVDIETVSLASGSSNSQTIASSNSNISNRDSNDSSNSSTTGDALRIKTRGADLKSGFPYHPALFDLHIRPQQWEKFTGQIAEATKMDLWDNARAWGAGAGVVLTTAAIGTSIFVGRSVHRTLQEKKVITSLADASSNSLGSTLDRWNESYFMKENLYVHLELSHSALKNPDSRSRTFRKPAFFYDTTEKREKKRDERKYVLVISRLDEAGLPDVVMRQAERMLREEREHVAREEATGDGLQQQTEERDEDEEEQGEESVRGTSVEIASSDQPVVAVELPAGDDAKLSVVELPAELPPGVSLGYGNEKYAPPEGLPELEGEIASTLPSEADEEGDEDEIGIGGVARAMSWEEGDDGESLRPAPLVMVTAQTHAMLHEEEKKEKQ